LDGEGVKYNAGVEPATFRSTLNTLVGKQKEKKKKLDKKYLPAIASILVLAVVLSSVMPAFATLPVRNIAGPTLVVKTIPEDDEVRKTGIMLLADTQANFVAGTPLAQDLLAQFKISIIYNGVPVTPSSLFCQVIEKDKYNPVKDQQFPAENLKTVPKDQSGLFVCKYREGKPGIGVLDVYYIGLASTQYISDYVLVVGATFLIGRTSIYGTEIQDICILGWPMSAGPQWIITKPSGDLHYVFGDPLGPYMSCEDAALVQKTTLGFPIPWT
jgi:hypothetical protein